MIENCKCIDFVFDLYLVNSVKSLERQIRAADESTRIVITHIDKKLPSVHQSNKQPSNFEKFTENKISIQKLFITCITKVMFLCVWVVGILMINILV